MNTIDWNIFKYIKTNKKYIDADEFDDWEDEVQFLIELYEDAIMPSLDALSIVYKMLWDMKSFHEINQYIESLDPKIYSIVNLIGLSANCGQRGPLFYIYCDILHFGIIDWSTKDNLKVMIEKTFFDGGELSDLLEVLSLFYPNYFETLGPILHECQKQYPDLSGALRRQYIEASGMKLKK